MTTAGGPLVLEPLGLAEPKRSAPAWVAEALLWSNELGGKGLFRISLRVVDDEVGVKTGD